MLLRRIGSVEVASPAGISGTPEQIPVGPRHIHLPCRSNLPLG
jgi:hypothetical protein